MNKSRKSHSRRKNKLAKSGSKLPQNNRIFTAPFLRFSFRAIFLFTSLFLVVLSYFNSLYPENPTLEQAKQAVLKNPQAAGAHLFLAQTFNYARATKQAEAELTLTTRLALRNHQGKVLGASTSLLDEVRGAPQRLENEVAYWQSVVAKFTDYRDAYLQLSALTYQLNRLDEAKQYLQKALDLDPNNPVSQKLQEFFSQLQ